jgi:hypothetical protein
MQPSRFSRFLILAALGAFMGAILIHNRGGVDPAFVPGALFTALFFWRPRRVFLILAGLFLAGPAILFLKWTALADPSRPVDFFNHVFLLLTAVLAIAGLVNGVMPNRPVSARVAPQNNP